MEYIRRFNKLLSKQHCIQLDCIKSNKKDFQKCNHTPSQSEENNAESYNKDDLNKSIHKDISDQELLEPEEPDDINESFTPLKNSNGTPLNSSTKLPVTISNDAPLERPILNLHGYKNNEIIFIDDYSASGNVESFDNIVVDDFNDNHFIMDN
jgi:hypothetical protein